MDKALKSLGKYWSTLLAHTDAELGIDADFTRPGVEALLDKFGEKIDCVSYAECAPFKWDHYKEKQGGKRKHAETN